MNFLVSVLRHRGGVRYDPELFPLPHEEISKKFKFHHRFITA
jgi:hypothetical protein